MATPATTSSVYVHVIDDVISKVRDDFLNGPGESVLNELQAIWEMKMMQSGAIVGPIERSSGGKQAGGLHDLNVPYEGTEEYETPTAEMLFPPTPAQTPMLTPLPGSIQTPLPGSVQTPLTGGSIENSSMYNIPTGGSDYPTPIGDTAGSNDAKSGRPSPYMQPPSFWTTQGQRAPNLDVNTAYGEVRDEVDRGVSHRPQPQDLFTSSGKRKRDDFGTQHSNGGFIPQQDGAGDSLSTDFQLSKGNDSHSGPPANSSLEIPQVDGPIPDPYDDEISTPNIYGYQGIVSEDYNIASTPAPEFQTSTPAVAPRDDFGDDDDDDDDDEPLNEDDDDDDLDDEDEGEEMNTQHLVLAQFDKVTRTKSRWKCTLKDGIMHINDKDILFNKATGEFDF